jgi:8-oxo-dGTP pyrophosphatase MutT (NUDIX family)
VPVQTLALRRMSAYSFSDPAPPDERAAASKLAEPPLFIAGRPPRPSNAVAGLLVMDDGRYVMQLRDAVPGIFFPGHWGCFGGGVDAGEAPEAAIRRELKEELEFEPADVKYFSRLDLDFSPLGYFKVFRIYFEVRVAESDLAGFVLHEGAEVRAFRGQDLLNDHSVTPYDAFLVWMHLCHVRVGAAG